MSNCLFAILNDPPCLVTRDGRVFSKKRKHQSITENSYSDNGRGYLYTTLKGKKYSVHKIVALAWLGERPLNMDIDHIDRNKQNNNIDNLRYVPKSVNARNRCSSDNPRYGFHWGSNGTEEHRKASKAYSYIQRKHLADKGLFKTSRIINGKRQSVVLPISQRRKNYGFPIPRTS